MKRGYKSRKSFFSGVSLILIAFILLNLILPGFSKEGVSANETSSLAISQEDHPTTPGEVKVFKGASPVEGLVNTWDITLRIEGMDTEKTSDIVLVIDKSGSMQGSKLTNAKEAARKFVENLIPEGGGGNIRIAIVSYSDSATTDRALTTNRSNLISSINGLTAVGGTHTQAGIRQAKDILDSSSQADYKHIVLLSDGVPTYSYGFTSQTRRNSLASYETSPINYQRYQGFFADVGTYSFPHYRTGKTYNRSDFNDTRMGNGLDMSNSDSAMAYFNDNYIGVYPLFYDHGNSTINEAKFAKNAGYTVWTVALSAGNDGNAILGEVANQGKSYTASESHLQSIFLEIAGLINVVATNMVVTDPLGPGFIVPSNQVSNILVSQGTYTYQNNTITWSVGDLNKEITSGSSIKYAELKYRVEITDEILGVTPDSNGLYNTNNNAKVDYIGINGPTTKNFPEPKVNPIFLKVTKELRDNSGNIITDNNRIFTINISSNPSDGDTIYPEYNRTFNLKAGESITTTDLRLADTYIVSESDVADYDVTINVGSLETNSFVVQPPTGSPLNDTGQADIHVGVTNKEKALGQLQIIKILNDKNGSPILNDTREFAINVIGPNNYSNSFTLKGGETKTLSNLVYGNYVVTEENPGTGFSVTTSPVDGNVNLSYNEKSKDVTITNVYESPLIDVTAKKVWEGGDGVRPTIWFRLYQGVNESDTPVLVPEASDKELVDGILEVKWEGLPKTDLNGNDYIYSVREYINIGTQAAPNLFLIAPAGYSNVEDGLTVTNIWQEIDPANVTSVTVIKTWEGVAKGETPEAIIELYDAEFPDVVIRAAVLTPENNSIVWEGLPYGKGNPIEPIDYQIREVKVYGYESSIPFKSPINISNMIITTSNNHLSWPIQEPSFIVAKPTGNQPFIIWTLNHLPEFRREAFIADLHTASIQNNVNLGPFGGISIDDPIIWIEGADVSHDIYPSDPTRGLIEIQVEFDGYGGIESSSINFQSTSSWTQFIVGTYAAQEFTLTNTKVITDIIIKKEVTGSLGDRQKDFEFEAQVRAADGTLEKELEDFTLTHNQTTTIEAPKGSYLWIREPNAKAQGYTISVTSNNMVIEEASDGWYKILVEDDLRIAFENNKDTEIYTGVFISQAPYILLLTIAIIALSVIVIRNRIIRANADRRYYDE